MPALYTLDRLRSEYVSLFDKMEITNSKRADAKKQALGIIQDKERYKAVEARTGIPWFIVGCIHWRESSVDKATGRPSFKTYLGNGEPLNRKTRVVPIGRGPWVSFDDGAYDALVTVENLDDIPFAGPDGCAYAFEKINGFGYRNPSRAIPSPYLWGGTNLQKLGKWKEEIKDGKYRKWYDPNEMDQQIGAMATLRMLMDLDSEVVFAGAVKAPEPPAAPADPPHEVPSPPLSPRADDTEREVKPLSQSMTLRGLFMKATGAIGLALTPVLDFLKTPYGLAVFGLCLAAICAGFVMVLKGRVDVQKLVKHLSQDDTQNA